jgi:ATP-dependent Clp protease ATP-binding subunit ClpC
MYIFNARPRYHLVQNYNALTSLLLLIILTIAAVTALVGTLVFMLVSASTAVLGVVILAASLAAAAALAGTFAATYFPFVAPRATVRQLAGRSQRKQAKINVASAAMLDLFQSLGPAAQRNTAQSLRQSVAVLIHSTATDHLVSRLGLNREELIAAIERHVLPSLTWETFARDMLAVAVYLRQKHVTPEHALGALLLQPSVQATLRADSLTDNDVRFVLWWGAEQRAQEQFQRRWWTTERLLAFSGIGLFWASGYTPFVDRFARIPRGSFWDDSIFGHERKLDSLINSLARQRQSNVLLVGDPGSGRLGIIRRLSHLVRVRQAHPALNSQRVLYINVGELTAMSQEETGQLAGVSRALREMERSGNIIVVLDGLSSILGTANDHRADLTDILIPFLSSPTVRVVVMASTEEYHLRIKSNDGLMQYFEAVLVPSLSPAATLKRLALALPAIERAARLYIPYRTINTLVRDTTSIMPHIPFPERAFDFLEEAIVLAQREDVKVLAAGHIQAVISQKIGINLGKLQTQERHRLLNLENLMHQRLVNQETAVKTVARAMIRARAQIRSTARPIGTFLLLGPTGVGKTETAKTLAEVYFGNEHQLVRLDMSEFQGSEAATRLIGSPAQPVGRLTSLIADHPFSVLLLDEFEKADEQVHQLFLQVFDEGHITDASGRRYSFQNAIIIATSNAGAELIRQETKDGRVPAGFADTLKDHILKQSILLPELLNRFDAVVTYTPLSPNHIRQIARLMLRAFNKRLDAQHGVTVAITDELLEFLLEIGYQPEFGARPMARAIQDTVEVAVAEQVLKSAIKPGGQIVLAPDLLRSLQLKN